MHTLQSINSPLLKLLEGDFRRRRRIVQVQTMRIVLLLVARRSELSFLMVDSCPAFGINPMRILPDHDVGYVKIGGCCAKVRFEDCTGSPRYHSSTKLMDATRARDGSRSRAQELSDHRGLGIQANNGLDG